MEDLGRGTRDTLDGAWNAGAGSLNAAGQAFGAIPSALASGFKGFAGGNSVPSGGWVGGADAVHNQQRQQLDRSNAGKAQFSQGLSRIGNTFGQAMSGFTNGYNGTPSPAAPQPPAGGAPQAPPQQQRPPILAGMPSSPAPSPSPMMPSPMGGTSLPAPTPPAGGGFSWQGNSGQPNNWGQQPQMPSMSRPTPMPPPAAPRPQAPAGPTPEQIAMFQRATASQFNPQSWLDRNKMQALMGGQSNWASNNSARSLGQQKIAMCRPWNTAAFWGLKETAA